MSAVEYAQMSTDELIQDFIAKTLVIGSSWNLPVKISPRTPEFEAIATQIYAISAQLRARKPIGQLRQRLFEHESRDVRGWAAGQFLTADPDWASATFSGLAADLPTREVLALRERARKRPPARPTVLEMSTDQLIARFEDAGIRQYATRFVGQDDWPQDVELSNSIVREMIGIAAELKSRSALAGLLPLLESPNISVRHHAATYCLSTAPERAVPVLEAVVASRDQHQLGGAARTLDRWRRGKLK